MSNGSYSTLRTSLDHKGGTKAYHLILIKTPDGRGMLIRRFGKVGQFGDVMVEQFPTSAAAEKAFEKLYNEKTSGRKGYFQKTHEESDEDFDGLQKILGRPLWAKLGPSDIKFLNDDADVSGVRERDPNRYDEDGNWLGNPEPRKADIAAEIEASKQQRLEELRQKNPLYGRF